MEGTDLFGPFQNQEQRKQVILKQFYIQQTPYLKHEIDPNPNAPIHLVRKIYQNYQQFFKAIYYIKVHLQNYYNTLLLICQVKQLFKKYVPNQLSQTQLSHKIYEQYDQVVEEIRAKVEEQRQDISQEEYNQILQILKIKPILKIFKIKFTKQEEQLRSIYFCVNKLKVMVIKALYKKSSTNLSYLIQCYTSQLRSILNEHSIRYHKQESSQNYKLIELHFQRHNFIYSAIKAIAKRFDVLSPIQIKNCKIGPHKYLKALRKNIVLEKPIFFFNFFTQSLLYIEHQYLNFDLNILYCPLVFRGVTVTLSQFYLAKLSEKYISWACQQLCIQIYHNATSTKIPLFNSFIREDLFDPLNYQYFEMEDEEIEMMRHDRLEKQVGNFNKVINTLLKIRRFVFVKMIQNWLEKIFGKNDKQHISIDILGKFKAVIKVISHPIKYNQNERKPEERPEFITNILFLASEKQNPSRSKQFLKERIYSTFQATLLKIAAEKTGNKVSWPLEPGSMGQHFFDYSRDKNIVRKEVKSFIKHF